MLVLKHKQETFHSVLLVEDNPTLLVIPLIPNTDLPELDQHASPNSKRRKINQMVALCVLNLLFSVN
ncbi:unnamed protein product, partial [Brassica napus]